MLKVDTYHYRHQLPEMDPDQLGNKTEDEWRKMSFTNCILTADRECNPKTGDIVDNQIVRTFWSFKAPYFKIKISRHIFAVRELSVFVTILSGH